MKDKPKSYPSLELFREPDALLMIQAPLPHFDHTLPILLSIPGQGTARERAAPLAPPGQPPQEEPHHDTH
ncbi:hypothetical protein ES703_23054 [subsurface metagenome]